MTITAVSLFFIYTGVVGLLLYGWRKAMRRTPAVASDPGSLISIIIPVRNESKRIHALLTDIQNQTFKNFEVIIVNDSSSDNTGEIVMAFADQDGRFKWLHSHGAGKKMALTRGIMACNGAIVVTTDGDCRVKKNWLACLSGNFFEDGIQMVFGAVKIGGQTFFSLMQAHEFLSLTGTAAATLSINSPMFCNGANLAFRKTAFSTVGGYVDNIHIPSGDDEFLMRKIFRTYPNGIRFVADREAVVETAASASCWEFVSQRIRWAGKWRHNLSFVSAVLAVFIFCFQISVIVLPVAMLLGTVNPIVAISLLLAKAIAESVFLKNVAEFSGVSWRWPIFLLLQIVYPFYVVAIGLISSFSSFEWKGRKLKSVMLSPVKK